MRTIWSFVVAIATFAILVPFMLVEIALQRSSLRILRDRLGFTPVLPPAPRRLLLHAVSAGEMNAASALVHEMAPRGWTFVLSAGNDDARRIARRIAEHHPEVEAVVTLPWDRRAAQHRFLRALAPSAVVVLETEIWPNLFFACRELAIPLMIAAGRIEPAAARRYAALRGFFRTVLDTCDRIVVINPPEAEHYHAAGADLQRIVVGGSLKADACAAAHLPLVPFEERRGIAAISTHPGEEELIVTAFERARAAHPGIHLTIAPRHVRRAPSLRRLASDHVSIDPRMGSVARLCVQARIVILGGTFVPVGGHDPLEPARSGAAVVAGPFTDHVQPLVQEMLAAGALVQTDAASLTAVLGRLSSDEAELCAIGDAARAFAASQKGASRRHAAIIEELASASH